MQSSQRITCNTKHLRTNFMLFKSLFTNTFYRQCLKVDILICGQEMESRMESFQICYDKVLLLDDPYITSLSLTLMQ